MRLYTVIVFGLLGLAFASTGVANEAKVFGSVRLAAVFPSVGFDGEGPGEGEPGCRCEVGLSGGFQLNDWVRWDVADFSYMRIPQSDPLAGFYNTFSWSITTNFRFGDFRPSTKFHPYISGGIGGAQLKIKVDSNYFTQWGMDANIGFGAEYVVAEHLAIGVRYRYRWANLSKEIFLPPPYEFLTKADFEINLHTIALEFVFQ